MGKKLVVGFALILALGVTASASATPVIDFGSGLKPAGGLITLFSDHNLFGTNVPIGVVNIGGTPMGSGTYVMDGKLSFSTGGLAGASFITVTGCFALAGFACDANTVLLQGSILGFSMNGSASAAGLVDAFGNDVKNADMLAALGLARTTPFSFFGWSLVVDNLNLQTSMSQPAITTDIRNTAVPEPASMLLLGTGLFGVAAACRRMKK